MWCHVRRQWRHSHAPGGAVQHERGPRKPKLHSMGPLALPPPHSQHKPHPLKLSPPSPYTQISPPFNFQNNVDSGVPSSHLYN
ncbi:unnamed protein product [Plutella xylostella]|uniref:(diamondback moth) hypothetical protein n=1 Tax=Plutella xylostella TaxID=51655 RepID=A0A8S4EX23_PLUXY|nr:unnamed protein product [Plutella xylostella]